MTQDDNCRIDAVLGYWFGPKPATEEALSQNMKRWFGASASADQEVAHRFAATVEAAGRGRLDGWAAEPRGALALVIVLDQFPRQLFRRSAGAFQYDPQALRVCLDGIGSGYDRKLEPIERGFFLMPLQHAESLDVQRRAVALFEELAESEGSAQLRSSLAGFAQFAHRHHDIIRRFGRFPHRNRYLGREDTDSERAYLSEGGARFGQ